MHQINVNYHELFRKLQGTWLSYEYMLNLNKTRSPYHSASFMEGIVCFMVDSGRMAHDTLHCVSWMNGHEDKGLWFALNAVDSSGRFSAGIIAPPQYDSYQQAPQPNDNICLLKIDSAFLTIYTTTFDSVRYINYGQIPKGAKVNFPVQQYSTKALFNGQYKPIRPDGLFGAGIITFDSAHAGRLSGSEVYDSFDINTDVLNEKDSFDYIEFFDTRQRNESRSFIYSFFKNDLILGRNGDTSAINFVKQALSDSFKLKSRQ